MKEVLAEAFEYTCNHMHEYWISHYPGYLRTVIAIIIFGAVGMIAAEIYEKFEEHRQSKLVEKDGK